MYCKDHNSRSIKKLLVKNCLIENLRPISDSYKTHDPYDNNFMMSYLKEDDSAASMIPYLHTFEKEKKINNLLKNYHTIKT